MGTLLFFCLLWVFSLVQNMVLFFSDVNTEELAGLTENYSGADIHLVSHFSHFTPTTNNILYLFGDTFAFNSWSIVSLLTLFVSEMRWQKVCRDASMAPMRRLIEGKSVDEIVALRARCEKCLLLRSICLHDYFVLVWGVVASW